MTRPDQNKTNQEHKHATAPKKRNAIEGSTLTKAQNEKLKDVGYVNIVRNGKSVRITKCRVNRGKIVKKASAPKHDPKQTVVKRAVKKPAPKSEDESHIGYIYILDTHLTFKNKRIVKIGKANDVDARVKQLNSEQGSYQKHTILYQIKVDYPYKIEHALHIVLNKGRANPHKEGFYKSYVENNIKLIKSMIKQFETA